jgi:hypothetical protein
MDLERYPQWAELEWHDAQMEEGDCLYIPTSWYIKCTHKVYTDVHCVHSPPPTHIRSPASPPPPLCPPLSASSLIPLVLLCPSISLYLSISHFAPLTLTVLSLYSHSHCTLTLTVLSLYSHSHCTLTLTVLSLYSHCTHSQVPLSLVGGA